MPITYSGVGLSVPSREVTEWIERTVPPERIYDPAIVQSLTAVADLPVPVTAPRLPPVRVGVLVWPAAATRWAHFSTVVTGLEMARLRAAVNPSANAGYTGKILFLQDDPAAAVTGSPTDTGAIQVVMTMLPPVPLSGVESTIPSPYSGTANDLYLLTLVDFRYHLWFSRTSNPDNGIRAGAIGDLGWPVPGSGTSAGFRGGATVNPDTYPKPGDRWTRAHAPAVLLTEALAAYYQRRTCVRRQDAALGSASVGLESWRGALGSKAVTDAEFAKVTSGQYKLIAGGKLPLEDRRRSVPASVDVAFGTGGRTVKVNKTLASLSLTEFGTYTGRVNERALILLEDQALNYAGSAVDTAAAAEAAAKDWYGWFLADVDCTLSGVAPWILSAYQDRVEWACEIDADGRETFTTRVFAAGPPPGHSGTVEPARITCYQAPADYTTADLVPNDGLPRVLGANTAFIDLSAGGWLLSGTVTASIPIPPAGDLDDNATNSAYVGADLYTLPLESTSVGTSDALTTQPAVVVFNARNLGAGHNYDYSGNHVATVTLTRLVYVVAGTVARVGMAAFGGRTWGMSTDTVGAVTFCNLTAVPVYDVSGRFATITSPPAPPPGPPPPPPPPPPAVTYDCAAEVCTDPGDGSGTYTGLTALADCLIACVSPPPPPPVTYNCDMGMMMCIDPGDGSGTYTGGSALTDCEAALPDCMSPPPPPPPVTYNCAGMMCTDPGDGTGTYTGGSALSDCEAACTSPPPPPPPPPPDCPMGYSVPGYYCLASFDPPACVYLDDDNCNDFGDFITSGPYAAGCMGVCV